MVKKEYACNAGDTGLIPRLGRSPGVGNGYPLQYSCQANLTDRGASWASILAWQISRTEEPNGLWSIGSQRVEHDLATLSV